MTTDLGKPYTVGQYLVDRLSQLGLEHLFSIAGDYTINWVNGCVQPSTIEVVEEVNELNAGYAAYGYARLKGIGALCVTYSAGALCAVNAIRVATTSASATPRARASSSSGSTSWEPNSSRPVDFGGAWSK